MLGSNLEIQGGSTGNQSAFVYGSNVSLTFASLIRQSSLLFNPTNRLIKSSSIGNGTDEKIRVDVVNEFILHLMHQIIIFLLMLIIQMDGM